MDEQDELLNLESKIDANRIIKKSEGWENAWDQLLACLWGDGLTGILPFRAIKSLRYWNRQKAFYSSKGTRVNRNFEDLSQEFLSWLWELYTVKRTADDWLSRYESSHTEGQSLVRFLVSSTYLSTIAHRFCSQALEQEIVWNRRYTPFSALETKYREPNLPTDESKAKHSACSCDSAGEASRRILLSLLAQTMGSRYAGKESAILTQPELYSGLELFLAIEQFCDTDNRDSADMGESAERAILRRLLDSATAWAESRQAGGNETAETSDQEESGSLGRKRVARVSRQADEEWEQAIAKLFDLRYENSRSNYTKTYQNYTNQILACQYARLFVPLQGARLMLLLNIQVANTVQQQVSRYKAFLKQLLLQSLESRESGEDS